jgi:hypothetical protein
MVAEYLQRISSYHVPDTDIRINLTKEWQRVKLEYIKKVLSKL